MNKLKSSPGRTKFLISIIHVKLPESCLLSVDILSLFPNLQKHSISQQTILNTQISFSLDCFFFSLRNASVFRNAAPKSENHSPGESLGLLETDREQIISQRVVPFKKILNLTPPSQKFEGRGFFYRLFL